jgi:hypothetical protein
MKNEFKYERNDKEKKHAMYFFFVRVYIIDSVAANFMGLLKNMKIFGIFTTKIDLIKKASNHFKVCNKHVICQLDVYFFYHIPSKSKCERV